MSSARLLPLLVLATLGAFPPSRAAGQAAAERPELENFRHALAIVTNAAAVEAAVKEAEDAARREPSRALRQVELGLALLRQGELGRPRRYDAARDAFRRAARLEPSWPWPHYGEALALAAISEWRRATPENLGSRVGVGPLEDAMAALGRALAAEPGFAPAHREVGRLAGRLRSRELWAAALAALRRAPIGPALGPEALLARGRIEREAGSPDSALAAFTTYLASGGGRGLGLLELARTRFLAGRPGADSAYFAGAALDEPLAVAGYRADLAAILEDSALAEFDGARGAARADFLRRFWADRDRLELRRAGERLREHYRRLFHARRHFAPAITRRHRWPGDAYQSEDAELDDRGVIYVRHGEPTTRVQPSLFALMPNESWRYARADGDLIFHFGAAHDVEDYRLMESALDLLGDGRFDGRSGASSDDLLHSREPIDPMYGKLAAWGPHGRERLGERERRIGRASIDVGTSTDSYELRFARPLPAVVTTVTVGRAGARSLVHVVYAIPGEATRARGVEGGYEYPVRLRLAVFDSTGHVVAYADTAAALHASRRAGAGEFLFGRFALPVPAGVWRYRLALEQAAAGIVLPRDSLRVGSAGSADAAGARGLAMSDLVLGWRPVPLTWVRSAEDTVFFSPFRSYPRGAELELFYEVYGLAAGDEYRTELTITSQRRGGLFRRAPRPVRLAFEGRATGDPTSGRRTIRLDALAPGAYWLDVVVTDRAGRREQRRAAFDVRDRPDRR